MIKATLSREITIIVLISAILLGALVVLYFVDAQNNVIQPQAHNLYNWVLNR